MELSSSTGGARIPVAVVTGASGVLGRLLVRYLVSRGWRVGAVGRRPLDPTGLPSGIAFTETDILQPDGVHRACEGADVVFHLAALRRARSSRESLARVNVDGAAAVARAARAADVRRFVYFGSTAVYGDTDGRLTDERCAPRPTSEYGRTKLEAESAVLHEAPGPVVLRVAAVYGPHVTGNYRRLALLCRRGIQIAGSHRRTVVYEEDAMTAALLAAQHHAAIGGIFNVTDGMTHTLTAVTTAMMAALRSTRHVTLSTDRLRAIARRGWRLPLFAGPLIEDSAVSGSRLQRELGFVPLVSLNPGWNATIEAWRAQGLM